MQIIKTSEITGTQIIETTHITKELPTSLSSIHVPIAPITSKYSNPNQDQITQSLTSTVSSTAAFNGEPEMNSKSNKSISIPLIVGLVVGILVLLLIIILIIIFVIRRRRKQNSDNEEQSIEAINNIPTSV